MPRLADDVGDRFRLELGKRPVRECSWSSAWSHLVNESLDPLCGVVWASMLIVLAAVQSPLSAAEALVRTM